MNLLLGFCAKTTRALGDFFLIVNYFLQLVIQSLPNNSFHLIPQRQIFLHFQFYFAQLFSPITK